MKSAAMKITKNVKDNSPLLVDATGNDGGKNVDATGDVGDEQLDATGNDGDEQVDATSDDVDEQVDATGDDGGEHVDATSNDGNEQVDATGNDGGKPVDASGHDVEEQVDATGNDGDKLNAGNHEGNIGNDFDEGNDGNVGNNGSNRLVCASVNHPGPCGWKIAHQCICKDYEVPTQFKGNVNESCLHLVHPDCMMLWEHSSSVTTPVDALSQFN